MPSQPPTATIRDVAHGANVSIKTVSRVVNNEPNVRPETRERVLQVARALQYEPNLAARGLAGRRTLSIGLLYETPHEFSYVKQVLEGAFAACEAAGYSLLLRPCTAQPSGDQTRRFVRQTRVDGVLLPAPISDCLEVTDALAELGKPFVQISPKTVRDGWASVSPNDRQACYALTEHVLAFGHRRIGFIKGDPRHGATEQRLNGHLSSLADHGIEADPALIVPGQFDFESGKAAANRLFALAERPTAIIASNDDMAAGVIVAARETGIALPEGLSVAGFDDSPTALHTWPPLTTVRQPVGDIAGKATEMLIERLGDGDSPPRHLVLECELVVRASMAAPAS
jgi:LacI family transcriptional regulator